MSHTEQGPLANYNSLTDRHLAPYFSNSRIRNHLVKTGLLTKRGEVIPDQIYRLKLARQQHKRTVRDLLAQAIVHKTLDIERYRQVEIRRKIEEIAKIEQVRRVRAQRHRKGDEELIPYFTQKVNRPKRNPNRLGSYEEDSIRELSPETESRRRLQDNFPDDDLDTKHLANLDSLALLEYSRVLERQDMNRRREQSPYIYQEDHHSPKKSLSAISASRNKSHSPGKTKRNKRAKSAGQQAQSTSISSDESRTHSDEVSREERSSILKKDQNNTSNSKSSYPAGMESGRWADGPLSPVPPKEPKNKNRRESPRKKKVTKGTKVTAYKTSGYSHRTYTNILNCNSNNSNRGFGEQNSIVGNVVLRRSEPALMHQNRLQSLCEVSMKYFGQLFGAGRDDLDPYQEVMVEQQHCGGNTLIVFKERLLAKSVFTFTSRRHRGYPFSLTFYINGVKDCRLSTCCEYKHKPGARLGGKLGHFGCVAVSGAAPCYKCQIEKGDIKVATKSKQGKKASSAADSEGAAANPKSRSCSSSAVQCDLTSAPPLGPSTSQSPGDSGGGASCSLQGGSRTSSPRQDALQSLQVLSQALCDDDEEEEEDYYEGDFIDSDAGSDFDEVAKIESDQEEVCVPYNKGSSSKMQASQGKGKKRIVHQVDSVEMEIETEDEDEEHQNVDRNKVLSENDALDTSPPRSDTITRVESLDDLDAIPEGEGDTKWSPIDQENDEVTHYSDQEEEEALEEEQEYFDKEDDFEEEESTNQPNYEPLLRSPDLYSITERTEPSPNALTPIGNQNTPRNHPLVTPSPGLFDDSEDRNGDDDQRAIASSVQGHNPDRRELASGALKSDEMTVGPTLTTDDDDGDVECGTLKTEDERLVGSGADEETEVEAALPEDHGSPFEVTPKETYNDDEFDDVKSHTSSQSSSSRSSRSSRSSFIFTGTSSFSSKSSKSSKGSSSSNSGKKKKASKSDQQSSASPAKKDKNEINQEAVITADNRENRSSPFSSPVRAEKSVESEQKKETAMESQAKPQPIFTGSPLRVTKVNPEPQKDESPPTYTLTTYSGSETDAEVLIRLIGEDDRQTKQIKLVNGSETNFKRGSVDKFELRCEDIGSVNKVEIGLQRNGDLDTWYLNKITVLSASTGDTYTFLCNAWFNAKFAGEIRQLNVDSRSIPITQRNDDTHQKADVQDGSLNTTPTSTPRKMDSSRHDGSQSNDSSPEESSSEEEEEEEVGRTTPKPHSASPSESDESEEEDQGKQKEEAPSSPAAEDEAKESGSETESASDTDDSIKDVEENVEVYFDKTVLKIEDTMLSMDDVSRVADSLLVHPEVETITLKACNLNDDRLEVIIGPLLQQYNLKYLNLGENNLTQRGARLVGQIIPRCLSLQYLIFHGNPLGDRGIQNIVEFIVRRHRNSQLSPVNTTSEDTAMMHLDIGDTGIGDQGAAAVAQLLQANVPIDFLEMTGNKSIGVDGWTSIGAQLGDNKQLRTLAADYCEIDTERFLGLITFLQDNSTLTSLDLEGNDIDDEGAERILEALREGAPRLTEVNLAPGNAISSQLLSSIDDVLARKMNH